MSEIAPQLPTDIEALQALIAAARAERDAAVVERDQALSQIDRLRHLLRQLQRAQFGRRSEKLDPEQLALALEDIEQAVAGNEAADDKKDPAAARARGDKRRTNRGALPAHLPRVDVTIAPEDTNCPCHADLGWRNTSASTESGRCLRLRRSRVPGRPRPDCRYFAGNGAEPGAHTVVVAQMPAA